jgi:hypothetical protein
MRNRILGCLAVATAALTAALALPSGANLAHPPTQPPSPHQAVPIDRDAFWALIDRSAADGAGSPAQLAALRMGLMRLSADQIAQFHKQFAAAMRDANSWDLWGAAYLANGGASDDGFAMFRCWLIAQGRAIYDAVTADPDRLAEFLPAEGAEEDGGELEFYEIAHVAREAWAEKTGRSAEAMPAGSIAEGAEPAGTPFSENPAELAKRYPRLWARVAGR